MNNVETMRKLSLLSLAAAAVTLASCSGGKKPAATTSSGEIEKVVVKVSQAISMEVEQIAEFTGTILPYKENAISPSIPTRIDNILVDVGDRVSQGQLLVKMDQTQYRQAAVQLATLETDLQRIKAVYEANGIPKQQLDAQQAQVDVSRASVQNLLENTELRSPISGVVTGRYYDPGDLYSGTPRNGMSGILTVMQIDRVKIQINVSEQYFPVVNLGLPVSIKLDIFPDTAFDGKVSLIAPAIDASTRTFMVEITIPNGSMKLRPGMFSRVALNLGKAQHVVIPDLAIQRQIGTNERFVYVVSDSIAIRRSVTVGRQLDKRYEILSGVENGEQVVTAGASKLTDGMTVEITR